MKWSGCSETNGKGRSASLSGSRRSWNRDASPGTMREAESLCPVCQAGSMYPDRKSTRLNSSHANISYAVFCLKKKNIFYDLFCLNQNQQSHNHIHFTT